MSTLPLLTDCLRLIGLHLNCTDISAMSRVCRQFNRAISSDEFWKTKITKDFGCRFPNDKINTICVKYGITPKVYYRRYAGTRGVDMLMRTWIQPQDIDRFYTAIVKFFQDKRPNKRVRIDSTSQPNDLWFYGRGNPGKTVCLFYLSRIVKGFKLISRDPNCSMCPETWNRIYIDSMKPGDDFMGSAFEFRHVFGDSYYDPHITMRYTDEDIAEFFFIVKTLYE